MFGFGYDDRYYENPYSVYGGRRQREAELRQRRMEEERRRRAELVRRRRMEEELARRREMELLRKERSDMERMRQRRLAAMQPPQNGLSSYPPGTLMLGPNGELRRVGAPGRNARNKGAAPQSNRRYGIKSPYEDKENEEGEYLLLEEMFGPGNDLRKEETFRDGNSGRGAEFSDSSDVSGDECFRPPSEEDVEQETVSNSIPQRNLPQPDIIVEDVPVEEDEELRDMQSVWRNRVPSPGEWMEPVEAFDRQ